MKKNRIIIIAIFLTLLVSVSIFVLLNRGKASVTGQHGNFNVVMIVADALRPDVLGCYGGDAHTPNIDWLAEKGLLFENAYSTAPCTMPSSVSMLTGNYSRSYGFTRWDDLDKDHPKKYSFYVNGSETLLAEVLKEKGYDVYKEVENLVAERSNNLQGFNPFREPERMDEEEISLVEKSTGIRNIGWGKNRKFSSNYDRLYDFLYYLLTVPEDQNFFLLKWFFDPHAPYNPPEKYRKRIPAGTTVLSKPQRYYCRVLADEVRKLPDYERFVYLKELYKAEVESVDERVGYIIKALKYRGILDKTIVIFTSDHGEFFGEHGRNFHVGSYYETVLRVPLIFMGPGIPGNTRGKTIVSHLDLMPTLKDLLDLKYDDNMEGKSYSALFSGGAVRDRILYFDKANNSIVNTGNKVDALSMNGCKLIVNKKGDGYYLNLFNLNEDPGEMKDVSEENPRLLQKMFKKILDFRKEIKARFKRNLAKIGKNVDLEKELSKTMEELKALGYL